MQSEIGNKAISPGQLLHTTLCSVYSLDLPMINSDVDLSLENASQQVNTKETNGYKHLF